MNGFLYGWWASGALIPLLIFLSRIVDVSIGTIRIICVSRGIKLLSAVLGFFEVLIWLVAISQIMKNLTSPWHYIAYAAGFGMGNFVGLTIEQRIRMGTLMMRVVTGNDPSVLVARLISEGYGVTTIDAHGAMGPVKIIFMVIRRKNIDHVLDIVNEYNPNAFYTLEDVKEVARKDFLGRPSAGRTFRGAEEAVPTKK